MARVVVMVGTDMPYAARVEFGFVGPDALGRVYNQAARPYLRPALDQNQDRAVSVVRDILASRLR